MSKHKSHIPSTWREMLRISARVASLQMTSVPFNDTSEMNLSLLVICTTCGPLAIMLVNVAVNIPHVRLSDAPIFRSVMESF